MKKDPTVAFDVTQELVNVCAFKNGKSDAEMNSLISELIKRNPTHRFDIVRATISVYIEKYEDTELESFISKLIEKNKTYKLDIVYATISAYKLEFSIPEIIKGDLTNKPVIVDMISNLTLEEKQQLILKFIKKNPSNGHIYATVEAIVETIKGSIEAGSFISELIKENQLYMSYIVDTAIRFGISKYEFNTEFVPFVLELIKENPLYRSYIVVTAIRTSISKNKSVADIKLLISKLIEKNEAYKSEIAYIAGEACYRVEEQQPIEKTLDIFEYCVKIGGETSKEKLKSIFPLILSEYFENTLINGIARNTEMEEKLFDIGTSLSALDSATCFDDIKLKSLSNLANLYLENRFDSRGVDNGIFFEVFLKGICDVMIDVEDVKTLYRNISLFENFKSFDFDDRQNKDITSIVEFLAQFGLRKENFTVTPSSTDNNYLIVLCGCSNHAFVMVIDRTKSWEEVTSGNRDNGAIRIIDSSQYILSEKAKSDMSYSQKKIFGACTYLNEFAYQKNGTCWFNAMAAVIILLQAKKEKNLTMEDIKKGFEKGSEMLSDLEQKIILYLMNNFFMLTPAGAKQEKNSEESSVTPTCTKQVVDENLPVKKRVFEYALKRFRLECAENRLNAAQEKYRFRLPNGRNLLEIRQCLCNVEQALDLRTAELRQSTSLVAVS